MGAGVAGAGAGMSEMVERVARAVAAEMDRLGDSLTPQETACVAIRAMREPTGAMIDAGAESFVSVNPPNITGQPSAAWRAMIDKALGD